MLYLIKIYFCFVIRSFCDEYIIVVNVVVFINIDCFGCILWKVLRNFIVIIGVSFFVIFV